MDRLLWRVIKLKTEKSAWYIVFIMIAFSIRVPGKSQEKRLTFFRQNSSIPIKAGFFKFKITGLNNYVFRHSHFGLTGGKPCP